MSLRRSAVLPLFLAVCACSDPKADVAARTAPPPASASVPAPAPPPAPMPVAGSAAPAA